MFYLFLVHNFVHIIVIYILYIYWTPIQKIEVRRTKNVEFQKISNTLKYNGHHLS